MEQTDITVNIYLSHSNKNLGGPYPIAFCIYIATMLSCLVFTNNLT